VHLLQLINSVQGKLRQAQSGKLIPRLRSAICRFLLIQSCASPQGKLDYESEVIRISK